MISLRVVRFILPKSFLVLILIVFFSVGVSAETLVNTELNKEQTGAETTQIEADKVKKNIYGDSLNPNQTNTEEKPEEEKSKSQAVIVNGDEVEYIAEKSAVEAKGNIEILYGDTKLTCDKITVNTQTKDALAEGNVVLASPDGTLKGDKIAYNFDTMKGRVVGLRFEANPYYGSGVSGQRLNESEVVVKQASFTTCDLDKPHYRMQTRKLKIYWGDKIVAENVMILLGNCPVLFIPKYVNKMNETKPRIRFAMGKDKGHNWGWFLLSAWRYEFNDLIQGRLNLDLREKRGFAWGVTNPYETKFGKGVFKNYYTNERYVQTKHWYYEREKYQGENKPIYKERYMFNLRHKWQMDPKTELLLEYFKAKDPDFIKDYFWQRYEKDMQERSYLQVLRNIGDYGSLSFYMQKRMNRFYSETEQLPTLGYTLSSMPLGNSHFYLTSENYFSNLNQKPALPTTVEDKSENRFDFYNKLSNSRKIAFIEATPYVALRETIYSRGNTEDNWLAPRTIFYSGIDMTTKFYRFFNVSSELLDMHYLRHVIQPTVTFAYNHEPTIPAANLQGIDGIDTIARNNSMTLELLNKLQTKRGRKKVEGTTGESLVEQTVDMLRFSVNSTYYFKPKGQSGSKFSDFVFDLEFYPRDWITLTGDATYDHTHPNEKFKSVNFDLYVNPGKRFSVGAGYRFTQGSTKEVTSEFKFKLNPKWSIRAYERFDFTNSCLREQEYTLSRDLHCWVFDISYNTSRGEGDTIWFVFRLKAFPDMSLEFNKSYHQPKPGSQGPSVGM